MSHKPPMEDLIPKNDHTLPVRVSRIDLTALDECRGQVEMFQPSRSTFARQLLRDGVIRVLNGSTPLQRISDVRCARGVQEALRQAEIRKREGDAA